MEAIHDFLPISKEDMKRRGIDRLDFVYVCGDAYVDHPSFGAAVIVRTLEAAGYHVAVLAQRHMVFGLVLSASRTGKTMRLFLFWENRVLAFWFPVAIWTLWSTIIRYPKRDDRLMPFLRAVSWENVRIMHPSYIAT